MSTLTRRLARRDPPHAMKPAELAPGMGAKVRDVPLAKGGINWRCTAEEEIGPGDDGWQPASGRKIATDDKTARRLGYFHYTKGYRSRRRAG